MSKFAVICPVCHAQYDMDIPDFKIGDLTHDQGALTCCQDCGLPIVFTEGEWELLDMETMMGMPKQLKDILAASMMATARRKIAEHDAKKNFSQPKPADGGLMPQGGDPQNN